MVLVLGVDSSTQSTKVEVRDADTGALVASGASPHPPTSPPRSEQDPAWWWHALLDAIRQTGLDEIAAMSIAGQQHGLVATDSAGSVLRPAKLWNDTESAPQSARLVERFGVERWVSSVGSVPVPAFTVTKLAWLAEHEPRTFARLERIMLPHDWLTFRLTGAFVTDRGDASGTGYWSPRENRWRPDVLRAVDGGRTDADWARMLPTVLGPSDRADWVAAPVHEKTGLRGRPLVGPGTGDNMAAALGVGLGPGQVAVSIGTSGTVYTVSETPVADPTGRVAGFADASGRFLPLVCTNNATKVTNAVAGLLGVAPEELSGLALEAEPGAGGLTMLPYLDGERTPNLPDARGALSGITPSNLTPANLARAAFEGVVCGLLDGLGALVDAGVGITRDPIRLVGGGSRSPAYRQILADLAGVAVTVPDGEQHVATGACVQAAATWTGAAPSEVAAAWGLGAGAQTEPTGADGTEVRQRYRAASDAAVRG